MTIENAWVLILMGLGFFLYEFFIKGVL